MDTAARLISKGAASSVTEVSPEARRARIARRVGSARAANVAESVSVVMGCVLLVFNQSVKYTIPGPVVKRPRNLLRAAAGAINHLPIAGDIWGFPYSVEGRPPALPGESPVATYRAVMPGYFATMRLPILRGRDVSLGDDAGAPGVILVNEHLAATQWPGRGSPRQTPHARRRVRG